MGQNRPRTSHSCIFKFIPFDALLDVGSKISMIDKKVCDRLGLPINPFSCDISHCDGVVGASMTRSIIAIMGWIEVELGTSWYGLYPS